METVNVSEWSGLVSCFRSTEVSRAHISMNVSEFPTTRTELNAVFDMFDSRKKGLIEYKYFVDALKTDRVS